MITAKEMRDTASVRNVIRIILKEIESNIEYAALDGKSTVSIRIHTDYSEENIKNVISELQYAGFVVVKNEQALIKHTYTVSW